MIFFSSAAMSSLPVSSVPRRRRDVQQPNINRWFHASSSSQSTGGSVLREQSTSSYIAPNAVPSFPEASLQMDEDAIEEDPQEEEDNVSEDIEEDDQNPPRSRQRFKPRRFRTSWRSGRRWLMHIQANGGPRDGVMKCAACMHCAIPTPWGRSEGCRSLQLSLVKVRVH